MLYKNKVTNPVAYENSLSISEWFSPWQQEEVFFFSFWMYQIPLNLDYHTP